MKTRIIYTRFWHDNYISELDLKEKLVFIYLITNEKVNICGIYELPDKYIRFDLDLKQTELDKIKQKFTEDNKFLFIDGWVKITNYDIYNKFTGEKNETAKEKELALIPERIIEYQYSIDRVSPKTDTLNNKYIINNSINNKKEGGSRGKEEKKNKYMEVVFLTKKEYQKLIDRFGEDIAKDKIEELNNSIMSKGYKYKSHYHTILCWDRKSKKGDQNGRGNQNNEKSKEPGKDKYKHLEKEYKV